MSKTEVIVIRETVTQSIVSDAGTFLLFAGLISLGVFLGSNAMQWVGAIVGFICMLGKVGGQTKRLTLAQARRRLDEIEADAALAEEQR